jgi:hypothetical protein
MALRAAERGTRGEPIMRDSVLATPRHDLRAVSTDLTLAERSALLTALAPRQLCAPLRAARRVLRRFLEPIEDAALTLGLSQSAREKVQRNVLQGMLKCAKRVKTNSRFGECRTRKTVAFVQ